MKEMISRTRLPFVLLPLMFFVVAPAFLLKENVNDLGDLDPRAFLLLALLAGSASMALTALQSVLNAVRVRVPRFGAVNAGRVFSTLVDFCLFLVVITAFVLPLAKSSGMVEPWSVPIHITNTIVSLGLASILTHVASSTTRKPLYQAVVMFIAANALTTIPALWSLRATPDAGNPTIPGLSSTRNVLVLSLDGISGSAALEVLEENPELGARFKGFTSFDRVVSSSPATSASTAASLYGNRNFKALYPSVRELAEASPERLLTNQLNSNGYEVSTHDIYNQGFLEPTGKHAKLATRDPPSVLGLLNFSIARTLTSYFVIRGGPAEWLDHRVTRVLSPAAALDTDLMRRIATSWSPSWKRGRLTPTFLDFRDYVRNLRVSTATPVAHFFHFTHTHFPVEFDRTCRFRGDDKEWFARNQNPGGVKEETYCALVQYSMFLDGIKALGLFDRSLIVLKSDHGKPVPYNDPTSLESFRIRGHPDWGFGRYRPFLAIKDFDAPAQDLKHDTSPVMLDDLARTLCQRSRTAIDCALYNGFDLIGGDFSGIEHAVVTMFVVRGERSDFRYESHDPISFPRGADILASLHSALSEEILKTSLECGQEVKVKPAPTLNNGHSDFERWLSWRDRRSAFLRFRQARKCRTTELILARPQGAKPAAGITIRVNGAPVRVPSVLSVQDHAIRLELSEGITATTRDVLVEVRFKDSGIDAAPEILGLYLGGRE